MNNPLFRIEKNVNLNRIRVESCISTILAIKKMVNKLTNIDPIFAFQFNKLESIIPQLKTENISESEVERIEDATNNLFEQMRALFKNNKDTEVYNGLKH